MKELDEGFLDFLKRLWHSIVSRPSSYADDDTESNQDINKIGSNDMTSGYSGVENLKSDDPALKQKLARIFIRGLRLHQDAEKFGVKDDELMKILAGVWKGRITLDQFFEMKQTGAIDRIYSRVRERVRYQRRKQGVWHENKD